MAPDSKYHVIVLAFYPILQEVSLILNTAHLLGIQYYRLIPILFSIYFHPHNEESKSRGGIFAIIMLNHYALRGLLIQPTRY